MRIRRRTEPGHAHGIGNAAYLGKLALLALIGYSLCVGMVLIVASTDVGGGDFVVYSDAVRAFLVSEDPYVLPGGLQFYNPPWALFFLLPFALLPTPFGQAALVFATFCVYAYTARRLGANLVAIVILLTSLPVFMCVLYSQIDWLVFLGAVFPPQIGMIFIVMKPQVGMGLAVYWVVAAWIRGGFREVVALLSPVALVFVCSLCWFGFWPVCWLRSTANVVAFWPYLVPVGCGLMIAAIVRKNYKFALLSGPCFAPHVLTYSLTGVLLVTMDRPVIMAAISALLWLVQLILCGYL